MTYHSLFPSVPFGGSRTWDQRYLSWAELNPSRGQYNWTNLDNAVNALEKSGGHDLIFTFGKTPKWAVSSCSGYYTGTNGCAEPPSNITDWDNFVTAIVTRYKGRIKNYETWNEWNDSGFYKGSLATMATLGQHLYQIAHSIDPNVQILSPDTYGSARLVECYLRPTTQTCTSGNGVPSGTKGGGGYAFTDVVAFHGYASDNPYDIINIINDYKNAKTNAGIPNKPLWDTESGWGNPNTYNPTTSERIAYVGIIYLLHWAYNAERFYWYAWDNTSWGTMSSSSGTVQPAGIAYREIYKWMVGASVTSPCVKSSNGNWVCGFARSGGYQALAVWNQTSSISYSVPPQYKQYRDLTGTVRSLSSSITLTTTPVLLETGSAF